MGRKRVLIVEDEDILRDALVRNVRLDLAEASVDIDIATAGNGQEALDRVRKHRDDEWLVFSDMIMPVMDGLKLFEILQCEPGIHARKILMSSIPVTQQALDACGAECFINKAQWKLHKDVGDIIILFARA